MSCWHTFELLWFLSTCLYQLLLFLWCNFDLRTDSSFFRNNFHTEKCCTYCDMLQLTSDIQGEKKKIIFLNFWLADHQSLAGKVEYRLILITIWSWLTWSITSSKCWEIKRLEGRIEWITWMTLHCLTKLFLTNWANDKIRMNHSDVTPHSNALISAIWSKFKIDHNISSPFLNVTFLKGSF